MLRRRASNVRINQSIGTLCLIIRVNLVLTRTITDQAASNSASCQIVSIDWLLESAAKKKPLAEKTYLLAAGGAADAANGADTKDDTKQNGKRPTRKASVKAADKNGDDVDSQIANGDDQKAVKKSTKTAVPKTEKKRAIKEEGDEEAADTSNKKQKNSQKANSKALVVPVDSLFRFENRPNFQSKWPGQDPHFRYYETNTSAKILRSTLTNQA